MNDEKRFVLQFRLKTESWQEDIMDQRFEAGRKIYNALVGKSLKLWNELRKTKHYRSLLSKLDHDKEHPEHDKPIWKEINKLRKEVGLTEFGLCRLATPLRQSFKRQVNAHIA